MSLVLQIPTLSERIRCPLTHGAPLPNHLEHRISCAVRSHHVPSRRTCTMICMVGVWSCALGVRGQSVGLGHRMFLTCGLLSSNPISLVLHVLIVRLTKQLDIVLITFRTQRTLSRSGCFSRRSSKLRSYGSSFAWTCLPRSLLVPSKSVGCRSRP